MGEIAEMMLDGTLCSRCGTFLSECPDGIPDLCPDCLLDDLKEATECILDEGDEDTKIKMMKFFFKIANKIKKNIKGRKNG